MNKKSRSHGFIYVTQGGAVELAENQDGKHKSYWKMIAKFGDYVDPRGSIKPMKLDKSWAKRIVENFKNGPITRVPVPLGHPTTSAELADKTKGWLKDAQAREDGLWGLIEIRDPKTAEKIENGLIEDVSVAFDDQYIDKRTGNKLRDVLKHVGLVNDPYIKGMTEFEPASLSDAPAAFLFSEGNQGNQKDNKEEITMKKIKNTRAFEIPVKYTEDGKEKELKIAPGVEFEVPEDQEDVVLKAINDAEAPVAKKDDKQEPEKPKDGADDDELKKREDEVAKKEAELSEREGEVAFSKLLSEQKVVPAQKEAFMALHSKASQTIKLADDSEKTVGVLLSELFDKAPKSKLLSDDTKTDDDDETDDDVQLSDEEKSYGKKFNLSEEQLKEAKKAKKAQKAAN